MVDGPGLGESIGTGTQEAIAGLSPDLGDREAVLETRPKRGGRRRRTGTSRRPLSGEPSVGSADQGVRSVSAESDQAVVPDAPAGSETSAELAADSAVEAPATPTKTPEDLAQEQMIREAEDAARILLTDYIPSALTRIINSKESNKELADVERGLMNLLGTADGANGKAGMVFKRANFLKIRELGDPGVNKLIDERMSKIDSAAGLARQKIEKHLAEKGLKDEDKKGIMDAIESGNFEALTSEGLLAKVEGLDKLIFGRELKAEDADKIIDATKLPKSAKEWFKSHGKDVGLGIAGIILLMFLGVIQLAGASSSSNR